LKRHGEMAVSDMGQQESQAKARQHQLEINEKRRQKYAMVVRALRDPILAQEVVNSAMVQVHLWQEKKLCSRDYIDGWMALLNDPMKAADVLEENSPYAVQMRQNAPFVSYIRRIAAHESR